jgi:hypothetical protein
MAAREPQLLELRIHGVSNTPPAEMLGVEPGEVTKVTGDGLGSFWTTTTPETDGVRTEAYSWGSMARNGATPILLIGQLVVHIGWLLLLPFGLCNVAYWMRRLEHQNSQHTWQPGRGAGTLRLFGLALTLLFTCTIVVVTVDLFGVRCGLPALRDSVALCAQANDILAAFGADGLSRGHRSSLFALLPIAAAAVLLFLCSRARVRYELNIVDEVRRDNVEADRPRRSPVPEHTETPVLASTGFWLYARVATATERLHFAAVVYLTTLLILVDWLYLQDPGCRTARALGDALCPFAERGADGPTPSLVVPTVGIGVAVLGLVLVAALGVAVTETRESATRVHGQRRAAAGLVAGSLVLFVVAGILAGLPYPDGSSGTDVPVGLVGISVGSSSFTAILLTLAVSALGWRRGVPAALSTTLVLVALLAPLVPLLAPPGVVLSGWALGVSCSALAIQCVAAGMWPFTTARRQAARHEGWRGAGPGVIMLLAVGVALTLSALVIVGAVSAVESGCADADCVGGGQPHLIPVPDPFASFALWLLLGLLTVVAVLGLYAIPLLTRVHLLTTPALTDPEHTTSAHPRSGRRNHAAASWAVGDVATVRPLDPEPLARLDKYTGARPPVAQTTDEIALRVLKQRRLAALAHRGEPALGLLGAVLGFAILASLLSSLPVPDRDALVGAADSVFRSVWGVDVADAIADWTVSTGRAFSLAVLAAIAAATLGVLAANALTARERPIGVLWDLISFLPRAGHPFAPPCYGERAVPEINQRIRDWFRDDHSGRRLIISAHSLGAVLAVASLFALYPGRRDILGRVGLLTYGVQLRPYFGRFFPDLLGPQVLGTAPTLGPTLHGADPWFRQVLVDQRHEHERRDGPAPRTRHNSSRIPGSSRPSGIRGAREAPAAPAAPVAPVAPVTLLSILSPSRAEHPAWISLWRRTDYLGFPANSYAPNPIDRGASEFESSSYLLTIASHSLYPDTAQYAQALADLRRRLAHRVGP